MMVRKVVGWESSLVRLEVMAKDILTWEKIAYWYVGYGNETLFYLAYLGDWGGFERVVQLGEVIYARKVASGTGPGVTFYREDPLSSVDKMAWESWGRLIGPREVWYNSVTPPLGWWPQWWSEYQFSGKYEAFESDSWDGRMYWLYKWVMYARRVDSDKYSLPDVEYM
jgi:hypothetical protein